MTHTTNYTNTLIEVAVDCRATRGGAPPRPGTVAALQFDLLSEKPYHYTSDDLIYEVHCLRRSPKERQTREEFFSKGQPCLRTSPLAKTYGWGLHHNADGKVALCAVESDEYQAFREDAKTAKVCAMRNRRA